MLKIDSHQHFWDLQRLNYPWLKPNLHTLYRNYFPSDLAPELAACGVHGTIVVQATHDHAETEWLLSLAQETSFIKGVVGWFDLLASNLDEQIDEMKTKGPLCGVRHQVHDEPDPEWLLQEPVIRGLQTLGRKGLPYDLLVRPVHLPLLPKLFESVPDMTSVVDHLAKPEIARARRQPWLDDLRRVAAYPNVYCKISGMITEARRNWTMDDICSYFEHVLSMFGPTRLMFGSDWPVCLMAGSYRQVHDLTAQLIEALSPSEQEATWSRTARVVYNLDVPQ